MFLTQLESSNAQIATAALSSNDQENSDGTGSAGSTDALSGAGDLGALGSPQTLGALAGLGGALGQLAGSQGLGLVASLGALLGNSGAPGGNQLQGALLGTLLQAAGGANLLGNQGEALATPSVAASAGSSLIREPSASAKQNAAIVADVARKHGVPPELGIAMMLVESSGNNRAVGDNGTSFGLFQLHKGGMLTAAGLTPEQAFDPRTNADVAMRSLAARLRATPTASAHADPGAVAAASQRPADPAGYAVKVNAALAQARSLLGPQTSV